MFRGLALGIAAVALSMGGATSFAKAPDTWDGLHKVRAKRVDAVYLLPNADFRPYTKVMLDPTQVAFRKDWQRDMNTAFTGGRISDKDVEKIVGEARSDFGALLSKAYQDAGYAVVTAPGPDVLQVSTAIINLYVAAPDRMTPGVTRTYSVEAGEATLALEARDSLTGALLGRAVDERSAGNSGPYRRTSVSNRADFEQLFKTWAKMSATGLDELKALSPIDTEGQPAKR